ncbi:MAG: type II toxin-antitoxin system RelB/DinJ family antitoxin [Oscillospiraceae bacterium]|nr:type II toxin-antitoxin system RelB/DinJ family antitoxin [Oscillospiraceae bacterium]
MKEQVLVQFRVDSELKKEVTEIYNALGMDLPTAFRMFMVRTKLERGIPFDTKLPDTRITGAEGLAAFEELRQQATDIPELSLDEINTIIAEVRQEKQERRN